MARFFLVEAPGIEPHIYENTGNTQVEHQHDRNATKSSDTELLKQKNNSAELHEHDTPHTSKTHQKTHSGATGVQQNSLLALSISHAAQIYSAEQLARFEAEELLGKSLPSGDENAKSE